MNTDVIIIGGGIVGLATALKIKERNAALNVVLLEKEEEVSMHQTGNNSGVIHSSIYYKPGSLKALNCLRGYDMLLKFCDENDIKYELCGKVIVASKDIKRNRIAFGIFNSCESARVASEYYNLAQVPLIYQHPMHCSEDTSDDQQLYSLSLNNNVHYLLREIVKEIRRVDNYQITFLYDKIFGKFQIHF